MTRAKVLLADDHAMVAAGLGSLIEPEFELVGTVADGRGLLTAATELEPDVIITDISMPLLNGLDAVRQLRQANPRLRVIFLTMHGDADFATEAFRVGASAYLLKQSASEELATAIREVLKGRVYITPLIAKGVLEHLMQGQTGLKPVKRG